MWKGLMRTSGSFVDTVLRIALAAVFFPHGAQKALGWFGGYGLSATMGFFTARMGIPPLLAGLDIAAEFLGPIALFFGIFTRIAAFGIFVVMATAVALVHAKVGFFMNWAAIYPAGTEGYEYHVLAMALAFSVTIRGAGAVSVDRSWAGGR
ncbi:MAG: DoxX family protein [Gemmatimonadota bacterium]